MRKIVPNEGSEYLHDESKMSGHAEAIFFPSNEAEVAEILRNNDRITISGNRTGLCGGSVPDGGAVLSLEKMDGIIGIGRDDGYFVRLQPCMTIRRLNDLLSKRDFSKLADITPGAVASLTSERSLYQYPVDPTELDGSFGGNVSTNASGPRTFKYGPTRMWIRRIRVVMTDGSVMDIERGRYFAKGRHFDADIDGRHLSFDAPGYEFNDSVKNAAGLYSKDGMDLIDLFIGSEGILGVVTEIDVRIVEWHPLISTIFFFEDDVPALDFISVLSAFRVKPEFIEYFDKRSIDLIRGSLVKHPGSQIPMPPENHSAVFFDLPFDDDTIAVLNEIIELARPYGGDPEMGWTSSDPKDRKAMFAFRHAVPEAVFDYIASLKAEMPHIHKLGTDMSVPRDRLKEMMDYCTGRLVSERLEYAVFGHLGNCHPHIEIMLKDMDEFERAKAAYADMAAKAVELGGSPSAEHGIGKIKTEYLEMMYGKKGVNEIVALKKVFDPELKLNPGDMVKMI